MPLTVRSFADPNSRVTNPMLPSTNVLRESPSFSRKPVSILVCVDIIGASAPRGGRKAGSAPEVQSKNGRGLRSIQTTRSAKSAHAARSPDGTGRLDIRISLRSYPRPSDHQQDDRKAAGGSGACGVPPSRATATPHLMLTLVAPQSSETYVEKAAIPGRVLSRKTRSPTFCLLSYIFIPSYN